MSYRAVIPTFVVRDPRTLQEALQRYHPRTEMVPADRYRRHEGLIAAPGCCFAIRLVDQQKAVEVGTYEIGVLRNEDGTYRLELDYFQECGGLLEAAGFGGVVRNGYSFHDACAILKQSYQRTTVELDLEARGIDYRYVETEDAAWPVMEIAA